MRQTLKDLVQELDAREAVMTQSRYLNRQIASAQYIEAYNRFAEALARTERLNNRRYRAASSRHGHTEGN